MDHTEDYCLLYETFSTSREIIPEYHCFKETRTMSNFDLKMEKSAFEEHWKTLQTSYNRLAKHLRTRDKGLVEGIKHALERTLIKSQSIIMKDPIEHWLDSATNMINQTWPIALKSEEEIHVSETTNKKMFDTATTITNAIADTITSLEELRTDINTLHIVMKCKSHFVSGKMCNTYENDIDGIDGEEEEDSEEEIKNEKENIIKVKSPYFLPFPIVLFIANEIKLRKKYCNESRHCRKSWIHRLKTYRILGVIVMLVCIGACSYKIFTKPHHKTSIMI